MRDVDITRYQAKLIEAACPAATLRQLCGFFVSEESVFSSLDNLNVAKFCWTNALSVSKRKISRERKF
jgi:hypothetical protein